MTCFYTGSNWPPRPCWVSEGRHCCSRGSFITHWHALTPRNWHGGAIPGNRRSQSATALLERVNVIPLSFHPTLRKQTQKYVAWKRTDDPSLSMVSFTVGTGNALLLRRTGPNWGLPRRTAWIFLNRHVKTSSFKTSKVRWPLRLSPRHESSRAGWVSPAPPLSYARASPRWCALLYWWWVKYILKVCVWFKSHFNCFSAFLLQPL